ncbi:hypothetical protein C8J57DRAFT_120805 [Mycena rebaudengoi]|nr:hypothetical protein C8J57DRAFT_120805 [Mycena rebaudengoi]
MSLLCLSASNVTNITSDLSPSELAALMAHVFLILSGNGDQGPPSAFIPPRIIIPTLNHSALFMPARIAEPINLRGTAIKVVCVPTSPNDAHGLPASTLVLDEETGAVKAIINAGSLTALRNAAGSLLSCNLIGPRNPSNIVVFGAGQQIQAHLKLFLRAFPTIQKCTIVNRTVNERASALSILLQSSFPEVTFSSVTNDASSPAPNPVLKETLLSSSLIICATSSTVPLFPSSWVSDGCHIILIGSFKHTMHEVDGDLIRRAIPADTNERSHLLVDSRSACLSEAGELIAADVKESQLVEIGELVSFDANEELLLDPALQSLHFEEAAGTTGPVSIFKSVGVGLQDVAIACAVVNKAEALGIGSHVKWD